MCLIAYSSEGKLLSRDVFDYARLHNSDGIGVMSRLGVERFVGRRSAKRAWRAIRRLSEEGVPYGVHFRMATHGAVTRKLCHPFRSKSGAWVMHNGVIDRTARFVSSKDESDTSLFVDWYMAEVPEPWEPGADQFFAEIEWEIGWGNKLLILHPKSAEFTIVNEEEGVWYGSFWFSNTYSLPYSLRRHRWMYDDNDDDDGGALYDVSAGLSPSPFDEGAVEYIGTFSGKPVYRVSDPDAGTVFLTEDELNEYF